MRRAGLAALLAASLLAGCATPTRVEPPAQGEGPVLPLRTLEDARHYRVVEEGTRVYARVFRGGRLAALGHNHVVLFPRIRGDIYLADPPGESLFDLVIPLSGAVVDPPALRATQGPEFQSEISDDARARTRDNMLGPDVLDAARHPRVVISSTEIRGTLDDARAAVDVSLAGVTRRLWVALAVRVEDGRVVASGRLSLEQSEFGITPFSTLGGALKVRDRVELVFTIAAGRAG